MRVQPKSLTLLELIIVIVLIGIVVVFAAPHFYGAQRKARDSQAKAILKLIQAAEKTYRLKRGGFTECADTGQCNAALNLSLSTTGDWAYSISGATQNQFCIQATGAAGTQNWFISEAMDEAGGACTR